MAPKRGIFLKAKHQWKSPTIVAADTKKAIEPPKELTLTDKIKSATQDVIAARQCVTEAQKQLVEAEARLDVLMKKSLAEKTSAAAAVDDEELF